MSADTRLVPVLAAESGVFDPREAEGGALTEFYRRYGFAVLRGLWEPERLDALDAACIAAHERLLAGELSEEHGTVRLVEEGAAERSRFANYVTHVTRLDETIRAAALDPHIADLTARLIGPCRLMEGDLFGVVYQDARPGRESGYSRIGWHSDWQSGPHLERWPSVAFTVHLDATSPDNGFLRVVPGSHRWATPAPYQNVNGVPVPQDAKPAGGYTQVPPPFPMPQRFGKVPGEIAVYCDRGDVLFHDAYLWHSAARATSDQTTRRHLRGGWYTGDIDTPTTPQDFVKNAAR